MKRPTSLIMSADWSSWKTESISFSLKMTCRELTAKLISLSFAMSWSNFDKYPWRLFWVYLTSTGNISLGKHLFIILRVLSISSGRIVGGFCRSLRRFGEISIERKGNEKILLSKMRNLSCSFPSSSYGNSFLSLFLMFMFIRRWNVWLKGNRYFFRISSIWNERWNLIFFSSSY